MGTQLLTAERNLKNKTQIYAISGGCRVMHDLSCQSHPLLQSPGCMIR